ncbi:MAG: chitobiase/beta-hexosaminidase C-terminal domain-containing protein [Clostridia bacterium]
MICEHCGHSMPDDALTCDNCGTYLGKYTARAFADTGVRAIRQGRVNASTPSLPSHKGESKTYGDFELSSLPVEQSDRARRAKPAAQMPRSGASHPDTRRGVPVNVNLRTPNVPRKRGRVHNVKYSRVNWMLIALIASFCALLAGGGYLLYMSRSDQGQRATARRNVLSVNEAMLSLASNTKDPLVIEERDALLKDWNKVPSQHYWLVGQDFLDVGDVSTAIMAFRLADVIDPENYDGLLNLANAYELDQNDAKAEELYLNLAKVISPFRAEAYTALIRMYQEQERAPEAADIMLLAYKNTDRETFRLQRKDYIPATPQIDLSAGRYEMEQTVHLTSPQGYDIYYTTDPEVTLPEGGTLAENGELVLHEGALTLRAVCVSGDLISDPLTVSYTIFYPSPPAPKCNLAPNTYSKPKEVTLRAGEGAEKEPLTFYYTIDGSMPTKESPVYDGTPIKLPSGRVTLRAVCVNQYDKMSSTMEVGYKFNIKPSPLSEYEEADTFDGFTLMKTSRVDFEKRFGKPDSEMETTYLSLAFPAVHLTYGWGYAVFILNEDVWQLARVEMDNQLASGPRGVGFGSSEKEICAVYKDMGQQEAPNGSRGLYYSYPSVGQVLQSADGVRTIHYSCKTVESNLWVLEYRLKNGKVNQILHYYQP